MIGVNSCFINGVSQLENGRIVKPPDSYSDEYARNENLSDLKYVLDHLKEIAQHLKLEDNLDLSNIALIGHSRGGMSIVNFLKYKSNHHNVKAIILMDPANLLKERNYPLPRFNLPVMTLWSSKFKLEWHGFGLLGPENYEVVLRQKNSTDNFSDHNNFTDESTLQYHPAFQIPNIGPLYVGTGNGYKIASTINDYTLDFLASYLKHKPNDKLRKCENLKQEYELKCGPGYADQP